MENAIFRGGITISTFTLRYGRGEVAFTLPPEIHAETIMYRAETAGDAGQTIRHALANPIGTPRLADIARGKKNAVIIISDATRLNPSHLFLPELINELNSAGIPDQAIKVIVALGAHRKQSEEELRALAGDAVFSRVSVENHSAQSADCTPLGTTSFGTPVEINSQVVRADIRILTGNIEPHRLAGMSGGVKALMPGVASVKSIEHNHSLSFRQQAKIGRLDNPVHADMMETLRFLPVHFLFNTVADHDKHLLFAAAGDVVKAHEALLQKAREMFIVKTEANFDLVIASAGGHPKDMQLYQAAKSLQNAAALAKPGGAIVLAARCEEVFGNGTLQTWLETMRDFPQMLAALSENFRLGAHKIRHIAEIVARHRVFLYSDIPSPLVRLCGFAPVADLPETITELAHSAGKIAVMPCAALTFPN
ncbi:MAG TPA: nickel-dependent lactate racemase [Bacilli bacterium]